LEANVVLPGYLYEPEYGLALRSLDAFLFLVPGSDGTCRAVREAMALGLPVLATRRGILPELVGGGDEYGPAGAVVAESVEQLATTLVAWHDDADRRAELGRAAARRVDESMDPEQAARRLLAFYERLSAER
ncbi:MAG: glycosyltransferase, partial [Planctomycetes bacterium]|nr:glycosyltransferase [Planctomycetota bacterium]